MKLELELVVSKSEPDGGWQMVCGTATYGLEVWPADDVWCWPLSAILGPVQSPLMVLCKGKGLMVLPSLSTCLFTVCLDVVLSSKYWLECFGCLSFEANCSFIQCCGFLAIWHLQLLACQKLWYHAYHSFWRAYNGKRQCQIWCTLQK